MIHDKTKDVWLFYLKSKDETFDRLCEWKNLVENEIEKSVKCPRTENWLEFF